MTIDRDNEQVTVDSSTPRADWTVIVPVKATSRGKSRIVLDPGLRQQVAMALAIDTVTAAATARSVSQVVVVAEDPDDGRGLAVIAGVRVHYTHAPSLNAAIADGLVGVPGPVAVLPGDLPGVTGAEIDEVLELAARQPQTVVADRQGTGTTLLTALDPAHLQLCYGPDSYRRHQAAGAQPLELPAESWIRRDVDTIEDLADIAAGRTGELVATVLACRSPRAERVC